MPTRRALLKTVGAGVGSNAFAGTALADQESNGGKPFTEQLTRIEEATKRYRDVERALEAGYQIMGPYVPAMGWHFVNPEYSQKAAKGEPSLVEPPMLTYNLDGELGSVEYAVPLSEYTDDDGAVTETPDLFNDADADREVKVPERESWHPHYEAQHVFSNGNGEYDRSQPARENALDTTNWVELSDHSDTFPDARAQLEAGDTLEVDWDGDGKSESRVVDLVATHPSQLTLHVWVHYENPHGVLAGFNPAFDQFDPPGDGHDHEH